MNQTLTLPDKVYAKLANGASELGMTVERLPTIVFEIVEPADSAYGGSGNELTDAGAGRIRGHTYCGVGQAGYSRPDGDRSCDPDQPGETRA